MRATVLKTNRGTRLFWTFQDSNGNLFDAEGCYQYCQEEEIKGRIQARKLINCPKRSMIIQNQNAGILSVIIFLTWIYRNQTVGI